MVTAQFWVANFKLNLSDGKQPPAFACVFWLEKKSISQQMGFHLPLSPVSFDD